jgi:glycosyltransferase involved in cell wall biosynthesis
VRPALPDYFAPRPKKLQIAYAPAKRPLEADYLKEYFRAVVPEYADVPWVKLQDLNRKVIAELLSVSAIYAALPLLESLGLMSLEAMASGAHVVGYGGHGGAEYARSENGDWIADGDHADFAAKLRDACRLYESGLVNPRVEAGRLAASRFNQSDFAHDLSAAWTQILGPREKLYRR